MEPARGRAKRAVNDAGSAEFFLPDLCASRSVFVMVLLAELLAVVHVLASSSLPQFNWDMLGYNSLFVQWVVLLSAALLCRLRSPLSRLGLPLASFCSLLVVVIVTMATSYLAMRFVAPALPGEFTGWRLLRDVLVAAVLAGMVLRYFYLQQQLQRQQKLELQARLDSLRARIQPHFLFNTLNSIASLIESRPAAAEQAVEDLSELFRVSLQESSRSMTVADELRLCELYLGIEQLRLGDRLKVDWEVPPQVRDLPMPSLLLQPLVENAIYHGVSQLPQGGTVRIRLALAGNIIEASVENPVPSRAIQSGGHNLALANIRERLEALYGSQGLLLAEPQGELFRVKLSYPREELV
jgi:two-component system sensor histidine kinase AlgZ